jgi:crossover junction endodeoxyribonuclease RuvC
VAVISGAPGRRPDALHIGVITTDPDLPMPQRLLLVEAEIESLVALHNPDVVAVERVFSQHNVRSAMGTAQAAAMGFLVAARHGITVVTHTPTEVKAAVTGNGRADKAQVTAMVTRLLQLPAPPKPADAADAVAIAVCHVWRGSAQAKINAALEAAGR